MAARGRTVKVFAEKIESGERERVPDEVIVESKSLKLYLFSFRQTGTFYEEIVNRIYSDLDTLLSPRKLIVEAEFTPRGGITSIVKVDSSEA